MNTGSFHKNLIWIWGVLKKSIFAYLKFDICIPSQFSDIFRFFSVVYSTVQVYIFVKVNISKYHRPCISESKFSPCWVCFIRSKKPQHQAFLEKMTVSGKGLINTRVPSRIFTEIYYQNICLIVPSCNTCTLYRPNGLGWVGGDYGSWIIDPRLGNILCTAK